MIVEKEESTVVKLRGEKTRKEREREVKAKTGTWNGKKPHKCRKASSNARNLVREAFQLQSLTT